MKIWMKPEEFTLPTPTVVTTGTFDGVHQGHQKVLSTLKQAAQQRKLPSVVVTYWPHPRLVINPEQRDLKLLNTLEEKADLIAQQGIDHLLVMPFSRKFSQLSSDDFINHVLINTINTQHLVIGYDHRFGHGRSGSIEWLLQHSTQLGFSVEQVQAEQQGQQTVSSSQIRKALFEGQIVQANQMLNHTYRLSGVVVKGDQNGRKIGFPTANLLCNEKYKLIPKDGVYAVWAETQQKKWQAMMNIGHRPTFAGKEKTLEVNLFGFSDDIYGETVTVSFAKFIREERKFASIDLLVHQLKADRTQAEAILNQF